MKLMLLFKGHLHISRAYLDYLTCAALYLIEIDLVNRND